MEQKMDFKKHIPTIEKKINYTFRDKSLLTQAFTRSSFCNEKNYKGKESYSSNEVLEFFGDSVLSCAIISLLLEKKVERYPHGIKTDLTEGDLSAIRSKLSDKRHLSSRTAELGLQRFLLLGEGDEKLGIADEASVMEDLFESIIGAIYVDSGMDIKTVIEVVSGLIDVSVYADGGAPIQSYKNALQEWCASKKHRMPPPVYKTLSESGPEHKRVFERGCYIGEKLYGVGVGKNQKEADTAAAKEALEALSRIKDATTTDDSLNELRALLSSKKAPSPEFHDLGEVPGLSDGERRFIVECSALGVSASGTGYSKRDARAEAAGKVLAQIKLSNTPQEQPKPQKKVKGKKILKKKEDGVQNSEKHTLTPQKLKSPEQKSRPQTQKGPIQKKKSSSLGNNTAKVEKSTKKANASVQGKTSANKNIRLVSKAKQR